MIVRFADIGGIVYHHCLNFFLIITEAYFYSAQIEYDRKAAASW